jgi:hypothetical protein
MPLPNRRKDETRENFISRCMSNETVKKEYPDQQQRVAVCLSKASSGLSTICAAAFEYSVEEFGYAEEITEDNFILPEESDYVDFGEDVEDWDVAEAKPGLWENIRKKKEREGKDYKPAKPGDKDRPDPEAWKKAQESKAAEYQGRKVKLNKPFRTPDASKEKAVYVKNDKGNVVLVRFGDKKMKNRSNDPERRKSFRARHKCDNPGPKWKARYWACKDW